MAPFFSRSCKPILGDDPADFDDWCSWRNRRFRVTVAEATAAGVFPPDESSAQQAAQPKPLPWVDVPKVKPTVGTLLAGQLQQLALVDVPRAKPNVDTHQAAQQESLPLVDVPKTKPAVDTHQAAQQESLSVVDEPTVVVDTQFDKARELSYVRGPIIYLKPHHELQGVPGHLVPPIAVVDRSWFPEGLQQSVAQDPAGLTPCDAVC